MDNTGSSKGQDDAKPAARLTETESGAEFRSVRLQKPRGLASHFPLKGSRTDVAKKPAGTGSDVIDKSSYIFAGAEKPSTTSQENYPCSWTPKEARPIPSYYPLERWTRLVVEALYIVVQRIMEANRMLSIHAVYCNETATADLYTSENVEMYLSLWKSPEAGILIEIQRRKGDSIAFHRYSRCILDAAAGELNLKEHIEQNGVELDMVYTKNVHRLLSLEEKKDAATERDNAIVAVEIAHGLLMKDRMDARQLGLESLCLLTDPRKTGTRTSLIASRVVLLGTANDSTEPEEEELIVDETPFLEIQQTILSLIQFRRIGEEGGDDDDVELDDIEQEHITVLHNLALAVLANALSVISDEENLTVDDPEEVENTNRRRLDTSESISERFLEDSECTCPDSSEKREIMTTLISELGKAGMKPHNACLSAKCLRSLFKASIKAREKAKELGAKTVVQTALEVGARTHLKLERECSKVLTELTQTNTE
mmetsp:Transcript_27521/g.75134  ORF Transcript_27521/g.75134 Transcript_27521/m.75134 type:complete len:485 (+) Transcript_27521:177-1631(+)